MTVEKWSRGYITFFAQRRAAGLSVTCSLHPREIGRRRTCKRFYWAGDQNYRSNGRDKDSVCTEV